MSNSRESRCGHRRVDGHRRGHRSSLSARGRIRGTRLARSGASGGCASTQRSAGAHAGHGLRRDGAGADRSSAGRDHRALWTGRCVGEQRRLRAGGFSRTHGHGCLPPHVRHQSFWRHRMHAGGVAGVETAALGRDHQHFQHGWNRSACHTWLPTERPSTR